MILEQTDFIFEGILDIENEGDENSLQIKTALEALFNLSLATPCRQNSNLDNSTKEASHRLLTIAKTCAISSDYASYKYAIMLRGIVCYFEGNDNAAMRYLSVANKLGLGNILIPTTTCLIHAEKGEMEKATMAIEKIKCWPSLTPLVARLQQIIGSSDKILRSAISPIRLLIESTPDSQFPEVSNCIHEYYLTIDRNQKSANYLIIRDVMDIQPVVSEDKASESYALQALGCMRQKNDLFGQSIMMIKKAHSLIDKAIEHGPDNAWMYWLRAWILYEKKHYRKALDNISHAIALEMKAYFAFLLRGVIYLKMMEYDKSMEDITEALHQAQTPKAMSHIYYYKLVILQTLGERSLKQPKNGAKECANF